MLQNRAKYYRNGVKVEYITRHIGVNYVVVKRPAIKRMAAQAYQV